MSNVVCLANFTQLKVTVIETFALPKLNFSLTVIPNPPENILIDINKTIYNFLWDNKPDEIKTIYNSAIY